jgi:hypothetical protein
LRADFGVAGAAELIVARGAISIFRSLTATERIEHNVLWLASTRHRCA